MSYVVYGLEDPRDRLFHYVGITDDVYTRFNQHIRGANGNIEKNGWIFECRQQNIMIHMVELQRMDTLEVAVERERYWIKHYLDLGHPLNNALIARSILRERIKLERLAEAEKVAKRRLEVSLKKQTNVQPVQLILDEKPKQVIPTLSARLQPALDAYKPGMSCRTLASLLGVGKDTANGLIHELKVRGLIEQNVG